VDKVVDPTGAGDTFAGGLMGYLSKTNKLDDKTLRKALLYATTVASFNVQGFWHGPDSVTDHARGRGTHEGISQIFCPHLKEVT